MTIPQAAPGARLAAIRGELLKSLESTVDSGRYVLGPQVAAFERDFAAYLGARYCIGVGSGTDAITLALKALGVGSGDEVVTASLTATATGTGILRSGAGLRFVDVEPATRAMDPELLGTAVSPRTAAIVVVHLHGAPAHIEEIVAAAGRLGLPVVEDCAQAHGAHFNGRKLGAFGRISAFSFYPTKNLGGMGDGGAVVTDDRELADGVIEARQYGWDGQRVARAWGINSRLDEIQAAVLRLLLPRLDAENAKRVAAAGLYRQALAGGAIEAPPHREGSIYHQFAPAIVGRDAFASNLAERGIETAVHYRRGLHQQPFFAAGGAHLPVTESLTSRLLSLPIQPDLFWPNADRLCRAVDEVARSWRG